MNEQVINEIQVGGLLKRVTGDGIVANTSSIKDTQINATQEEINADVASKLVGVKNYITPDELSEVEGKYGNFDVVEGDMKTVETFTFDDDSIAYKINNNTVIQNIHAIGTDNPVRTSEVRYGTCVSTKTAGSNPLANIIRNMNISFFDKAVELYRNGYSNVEDCQLVDNNTAVSVDTSGSWIGAIGINGCHIRRNQTGIYVSDKATNQTVHVNKCTFEGNLVNIDCAGNLVVRDCWFGDAGVYERNNRGGRRLAVVHPGATITFENCTLGVEGTWRHSNGDTIGLQVTSDSGEHNDPNYYDFGFDMLGTDENPCKVIIRNCLLGCTNMLDAHLQNGQWAINYRTNSFMYQSASGNNVIVFENCTIDYGKGNKQKGWLYHSLYTGNVRDYTQYNTDLAGAGASNLCKIQTYSSRYNYAINGYFDDTLQNTMFAKQTDYTGASNAQVLQDKNFYGGNIVRINHWNHSFYYRVPANLVGKEMSLVIGTRGFNNINSCYIDVNKSDLINPNGGNFNIGTNEIMAGGMYGNNTDYPADCHTTKFTVIPTKEFGKFVIYLNYNNADTQQYGADYVELSFIKLVEQASENFADKDQLYDNTLITYTFDDNEDLIDVNEGRSVYNDKLGAWSDVKDGSSKVIVGTYIPKITLPFNGVVNDEITIQLIGYNGAVKNILWSSVNNCFVATPDAELSLNTRYYNDWTDNTDYTTNRDNDGKAFVHDGDIYIYTYDTNGTNHSLNKLNTDESVLTDQMLGREYPWTVEKSDTTFVIQHDYNLCGKTITVPARCTLIFDGGSIKNGTIVGNNTKVDYNGNFVSVMQANITGTWIGIGNTKTKRSGTTAQRPTDLVAAHDIGYMYFDTQLGKAVWASAIGANGEVTWVDTNYSNISAQVASDLGMIPNDPSAATTNAGILENVLRAGRNLVVDNFYYINGQHVVDYTFSCTGQNGGGFHWVATPGNYQDFCFLITEGGSISLDSLKIVTNVGRIHWNFVYCDMTRGSSLQSQSDNGYIIDMIEVKNCDISGGNFLEILCDNVNYDFADTRYGINKVKIYNNRVHDINQDSVNYYQPTDNSVYAFVFKDCPILLENVVSDNSFLRVNGICVREYIYNSGSFHAANTLQYLVNECPVNIERNVFDNTGLIGDTENYTCLAFIEKFVCIYRNNTITNIITVAPKRDVNGFDGPTYDCYLSCTNLIYENNVCRNIASFHPGTQENPVTSATLFGRAGFAYSKGANDESNGLFSSRKIVNSRFVNNYEEIYNIVSSRINLPAPADENSTLYDVFEGMLDNCVSYFGYATDTFNYQEYRNNYVDVGKARIGITTTDGAELHFVSNKLIAKGLDSTPLHYAASGDISVIEICNNYFDMDSIELIRKKSYNNTYIDTNCNSFIVENNIVKKELRIFSSAEAFRHFKCGIYKFKNNTCLCVPDGSNAPMYRISCSDYGVFEHANVFNNDASHTYIGPVDNCDCELIRKIYRLERDGTAKANILRIMYNDLIRDPNDATYNTETQYYKVDVSIDDILYKDTFYIAINRVSTTLVNEDGSININLTPTLPTSSNDTLTSSGWQSIDSDTQFQFGVDMIKDDYYGAYGYFQLYFKTNLTSTVVKLKAKRVLKGISASSSSRVGDTFPLTLG